MKKLRQTEVNEECVQDHKARNDGVKMWMEIVTQSFSILTCMMSPLQIYEIWRRVLGFELRASTT
jgi:hypothetical protein